MGSNTSKLRKALQRGEEVEAMHIYLKNPDIKRNLDPSGSYGDSYDNNTALHYASSYAMKHFIRSFLVERGNPNKRNSKNQTAIHCICTTVRGTEETVDTHRAECLSSFLQWKGKDSESIELDAVDKDGNTALHCAAMSGLLQCVQLLVANRASLYIENNDGLTACDCAIHKNFNNIAAFLETKMVFSEHGVTSDEIAVEPVFIPDEKQKYRGLCEQDLQEAKDQLLVETADMLRVPLFTAEALLRYYEWSREQLVEGWMSDPAASCEKAGVKLPPNHCADKEMFQATASELKQSDKSIETCDICADEIKTDEGLLGLSCTHEFCRGCWESYLNFKIEEGDAHNIQCPMFACNTLVPQDIIESLVSKEMVSRYLKFDIKAFVESNPNLKWCPAPRCGRAVRLPPDSSPSLDVAKKHGETAPLIVDCGNGHYFCWNCLNDAHEPCSCEQWQKWLNKIAEMLPKLPAREHLSECPETEVVANTLWLVTNSKPCPNCKSPIEKNEGCNHVKCTKCKYEFCWVCLELWKLHSSATGGYFKCNRFEVVQKLAEDSQKVVNEVSSAHKKIMELNYFLHYYSRFKNHENSYKLEEPLLGTAKDKMVALALAAQETAAAPESIDTSFIEDAVSQLLMSRRVLRASYGYGFFLVGSKDKKTLSYEQDRKTMFELMQTEVEEATEEVSQMVARPYLRTPRSRIIQCTQTLQRKRKEFLLALSRGLIPDEEPPFAIPSDNNPFSRLRFHFPGMNDESDEDEENYEEFRRMIESSIREQITRRLVAQESFGEDVAANIEATPPQAATRICARNGCERPRSVDRLSGLPFKYCSLNCLRRDRGGLNTANSPENRLRRRRRRRRKANREHDVDHFVRAIQLSVQEERDESSPPRNLSQRTSSSSSSDSSENENAQADSSGNAAAFSNSESEESASFQRAIELSIQASRDNHPNTPGSNQDHDSRDFNLDYDLRRAIELSLQESLVADGDTPHSTIISKSGDLENADSRQSNLLPIQTEDAESLESDEFLTVL